MSNSNVALADTRRRSRFAVAVMLFILLNWLLYYRDNLTPFTKLALDSLHFDFKGTETGADKSAPQPTVLLAGSSLLLYPMWRVDQAHNPTGLDSNHYHDAQSLDDELAKRDLQTKTYDLAVGGCMMSDTFLLLTHYLNSHPAPQYIIVDCAPRSFYDGGIVDPSATPIFDACFTAQDFVHLSKAYLPTFAGKLNYIMNRLCFTYHHRQCLAETIIHSLLTLTAVHGTNEQNSEVKQAPLMMSATDTPASTEPAAPITAPIDAPQTLRSGAALSHAAASDLDTPEKFEHSVQEYNARYFLINPYQMQTQLSFLTRITQLCNARKIKVLVINMPLSSANLAILPVGFYDNFKLLVKSIVGTDATFVDLSSGNSWPRNFYFDSVHLNDQGGSVLNRLLAELVTSMHKKVDSSYARK